LYYPLGVTVATEEGRKAYKGLIANPEFVKEFYERVKVVKHPDACWIWQGYIDSAGFGRVRSGRRTFGAHRVAYELANGALGKDTVVKQVCNARCCVRPEHLVAKNAKRTKRGQVKGSWAPYVHNLTALTTSIFEEDERDLVGGVKVVFGDDPQVAVDKLSPLLRTLGDAVAKCVRGQADVLNALRSQDAKVAAIPGLAARHVELIEAVERLEGALSHAPLADVSRETSPHQGPGPGHVSRETSPHQGPGPGHVSRETLPNHQPDPGPDVSRETSQERLELQQTLGVLFEQELGSPCDDPCAVAEAFDLALAYGGTGAGDLLRGWMQEYSGLVQSKHRPPLAAPFLAWCVDQVSAAAMPGARAAPAEPALAPAACASTPGTPPPSSQAEPPTPRPADEAPAPRG
jgi:hypothetical protein